MEDIKIGSIVEPTTPVRRETLGKGIVVAVKQSQRLPVTVVFPGDYGIFINYDFTENHLTGTTVDEGELKLIVDAAYNYRQLLGELRRA